MRSKQIAILSILTALLAFAQDKQAIPPARKAVVAPTNPSPINSVIEMVKAGIAEPLIITYLHRHNTPMDLNPTDLIALKNAGVSQNIIAVMMDPAAAATNPLPVPVPPDSRPHLRRDIDAAPEPVSPPVMGSSCPAPAPISAAAGSQKRRLAVSAFDYSAVKTQVTAMFNNDVNVGQGIRAMLTVKMNQSKNVVLLEREKLKQIMVEEDLGSTSRFKRGNSAKIGGLTGADAMLFGDIVIFGRDDKAKQNSSGGIGCLPVIGCAGDRVRKATTTDKAVVAINLRLVDAETGEVLDSAEERGESQRTSTDWGSVAGAWRGAAAGSSGMTSSNFQETIIGEATQDAVNKIAAFISGSIPQIAAKGREIEGRVASFDGCDLFLNIGGNDGVHVGDRFEIFRIVKELRDPQTNEVLDVQTERIGDFYARTVRDKMTIGSYGGRPLTAAYINKPGYAARLVGK